jgi:CTP:molybdopterin cytidylyltransferase MocA
VWVVTGADPAVAEAAAALGARTVANPAADAEQIDSLRVALRALPPEAEAAAVALVDVPEVDADTVRAVLDGFRRTRAPVVLPAHGGRHGHPVLFARAAWAELLAAGLAEGARTVVHAHAADRVEVAVPALPRDVDTPDDYRRLLASACGGAWAWPTRSATPAPPSPPAPPRSASRWWNRLAARRRRGSG